MIKGIPLEPPTQQPSSSKCCELSIYVVAGFSTRGVVEPFNSSFQLGGGGQILADGAQAIHRL